ncbi:hypothetical protein [Nibricoccus sp. IMCC34717]|uniref:hypothetical protein n=1 Tax=Nibricoccus sp. IMCC34717 TaxID=3034021 RepID=UPI00384A7498
MKRLLRFFLGLLPWLALAGGTAFAYRIYFTERLVGGTDAIWYAHAAHDAIEQFRSGVFPVLVGDSEFNWVGSVHPLRSAPAHFYLLQGIDLVTLHSLRPLLLQHLALVAAAIGGALSLAWVGRRIAPRLGLGWLVIGWLYATAPIFCTLVGFVEAYMSFTTLLALPWFALGLHRVASSRGREGFVTLGLAVVGAWLCHPPIALVATLASLFTLCVLTAEWERLDWGAIARGAAAAGGAGLFYFVSMADVPRGSGSAGGMATVALLALLTVAWVRFVRDPRSWGWLVATVLAVFALYRIHLAWALWFIAFAPLAWLLLRWRATEDNRAFRCVLALVGATLVSGLWLNGKDPKTLGGFLNFLPQPSLQTLVEWVAPYSLANTPRMNQPGPAIVLLAGVGLVVGWRSLRERKALLLFAFALVLVLLRVPVLSAFLANHFPADLSKICNYPLAIRFNPVVATALITLGASGLAAAMHARWGRLIGVLSLAVTAGWNGLHLHGFDALFHRQLNGPEITQRWFDANCRPRRTFEYDLATLPNHFFAGVTEPLFELRFSDREGNQILGATQIAAAMEVLGSEKFILAAHSLRPRSDIVFELRPTLTASPGETKVLRVVTFSEKARDGIWAWNGLAFYREYLLSSDPANSYALNNAVSKTSVLTLTNTQQAPLRTTWEFVPPQPATFGDVTPFADVVVSTLDRTRGPLRMPHRWKSLFEVDAPVDGTLETFRIFVPGYNALVDGKPTAVTRTGSGLVGVPLTAGTHQVAVSYRTPLRIQIAGWISALTVLALAALAVRNAFARSRAIDTPVSSS